MPCYIGRHAADNVAESLSKGTRVLVTGVLRQREWETTTGDKRHAYEVHATEVAVSLNQGTVQVTRPSADRECRRGPDLTPLGVHPRPGGVPTARITSESLPLRGDLSDRAWSPDAGYRDARSG